MTTNTDYSGKARAVLLAAIMVVSVVGMSMAFAGSAAAAVSDATLENGVIQPGDDIQATGSVDGNYDGETLYIVISDDGTYDDADDAYESTTETAADDDTFDVTASSSNNLGLEGGDSVSVYVNQGAPENGDDLDAEAGTLDVDGTGPSVTPDTPADGDIVSDTEQSITAYVGDDVAANDTLQIRASVDNNGNTNTYEINPDSDTNDDGVGYAPDTGLLTIDASNGNIPDLQDGTVEVSITATDSVGNENTESYSFEVQTDGPSSDLDMPDAPYSIIPDDTETEEFVTNDENETVEVSLSSDSNEIDDESVTITLDGPGLAESFEFTNTDDQYSNNSNTFSLTPEGGDYAFDEEGEYTVTAEFDDEAGNSVTDTHDFHVDTTGPDITDVTVDEVREDQTVVPNRPDGRALVFVTVADDTTLPEGDQTDANPSTIEATVNVDGEEKQPVDNFQAVPEDRGDLAGDYYGTLDLADSDYSGIENNSAYLNVTVADDNVGNALQNPAEDGASDTTFDVDTDGPDVSVSSPDKTLGGYVNFTELTETSDVVTGESNVDILVGQDSNSVYNLGTLDDAKDIDTTDLPDGTHTLSVTVNDDADPSPNTETDTASFTLDNQQPVDVQQPYLAGFNPGYDYPVDGQFNLSTDVFDAPADADYSITDDEDAPGDVSGEDLVFDANNYDNTDTVSLNAEVGGETFTTTVEVDAVSADPPEDRNTVITTDGDSEVERDNPSTINVSVNSELVSLNATVDNQDSYFSDQSVELTGVGSNGDFSLAHQNDGTYYYEAAVPSSLRDGQFVVTVGNATSDTQVRDLNTGSDSFVVDNERPTVTDADIAGVGQDGRTQVRVQFSEPVSVDQGTVEGITASDGTSVNEGAAGADYDGTDGEVVVEFDDVLQTGDGLDVTYAEDTITEHFEVDDGDLAETNDEDLTQTVDTVDLDLSEGQNLVSVPAETGTVSISDLNTENVETIYAWDEGSWTGYAAGDDTSDLQALEGGQGYIVTMSADDEIPVQAYNKPGFTGDNSPMTDEPIEQGWNLIGHWQEAAQDRNVALGELDDTTYDSANVLGEQDDGSFGAVAQLQPGAGYWLYADDGDDNYARTPFDGSPVLSGLEVSGQDGVDGTVRTGENVDISIEADDVDGITTVEFDSQESGTVTLAEDAGVYTATDVNVDTSGTAEGRDIGTITATDNTDSESTESVTVDVVTQPAIQSAEVTNANQDEVRVEYGEAVTVTDDSGFTFDAGLGGLDLSTTGASVADGDDSVVVLTLDGDVVNGNDLTGALSYDQDAGNVQSADGIAAAGFSNKDVTNNVDAINPSFSSAEVTDGSPNEVRVTFNDDVSVTDDSGFTFDAAGLSTTDASVAGGDNSVVVLTLGGDVANGDDLNGALSYDQAAGTVQSAVDSSPATGFSNEDVTNSVQP